MSLEVRNVICSELYADLKNITDKQYFLESKKQSFLITGGSGFIAYYIVMALLCRNDESHCDYQITILVRSEERARKKYGELLDREDFHVLVQDVCQPFEKMEQSYDYIIHAASAADAQHFEEDPIGVFNSNVIGTEHLIDFIRQKPCKSMVYLSSFTVYGNGTDTMEEVTEEYRGADDWMTNRSCYAFGKRSAEFLCAAAQRKYGVPIRIVRPGFVYGGSTPMDNRVYAEIIRNVAENKPIVLQSPGLFFRSMIYVTDVVRGVFQVLFCGADGEAYNIANEFVSIRDFAKAAVQAADTETVVLQYLNAGDENVMPEKKPQGAMSAQKLIDCGWKPAISLEQGIQMASRIYRYTFG